ncbi:hypothetical protein [Spiroplasma endosymbiont of Dilophus febrilis]|uniref:hypothetical protein n=1 Tax=Spiroplasma endosymbiont of Dilophus febrilis TaxID=3066292 RepID=UPI00313CF333
MTTSLFIIFATYSSTLIVVFTFLMFAYGAKTGKIKKLLITDDSLIGKYERYKIVFVSSLILVVVFSSILAPLIVLNLRN